MGFFSDILKGLPENAVLRQKNTELEAKNAALDTEVAILKDELREATGKAAKLEKRIEDSVHIELDGVEVRVLQLLAEPDFDHHVEVVAVAFHLHEQRAQYHLDRLLRDDYLYTAHGLEGTFYYVTDKGRDYLVKNNLI